jgi:GH24 family phage-related lysozyme (muramidase)
MFMIKRVMCAALVLLMGLSIFVMVPMQATAVDMHVSSACVELIKQMEGFTAVPVWDYSQWTVGFGTSCPSEHRDCYQKDGIPVEEAEALLAEKLVYFD